MRPDRISSCVAVLQPQGANRGMRSLAAIAVACITEHARALAVPGNIAYASNYGSEMRIDQAAFSSPLFWDQMEAALPTIWTDPELERFRGWVHNLRTEPSGKTAVLSTGQEVLSQYMFPGLQDDDVTREAFPPIHELGWDQSLRAVAPFAQDELVTLLQARPLVDDDAPPPTTDEELEDAAGEAWNKAAWYGWQFMSLRDAKPWMPKTIGALRDCGLPAAHRFIGIARQRPKCEGTLHSDRRNYLLSTLTPLIVPSDGACGVVVPGHGERELHAAEPICLDNTFKHYVYNRGSIDRFVLMIECWHPALTAKERDALSTTFAVKDRFTLLSLKQCPWGFGEEELMKAIRAKQHFDLGFWRDPAHDLST